MSAAVQPPVTEAGPAGSGITLFGMTGEPSTYVAKKSRAFFWIFAVVLFVILMQPMLDGELAGWIRVVAFATWLVIVGRVSQLQLIVTETDVIVVNFFRTVTVPLDDVEVRPLPKGPGYLEISDSQGQTISIGGVPVAGQRREAIANELRRRVSIARGQQSTES